MFSVLYQAFFSKSKSNNGSKSKIKNCSSCGRKINVGHRFCTYCGSEQKVTSNSTPTEKK